MKQVASMLAVLAISCSAASDPVVPLASGKYVFQHRFAEHPSIPSMRLNVTISGDKITLTNPKASDPFPAGVIEQGRLIWHQGTGSWVIGQSDKDGLAPEVGGCSDGPHVVDLLAKIYWTC